MEDVIFNQWDKGVADSAILGHQDIRNVNIHIEPGVARANLSLTKESGTTVTGLIKWEVIDSVTQNIYGLDDAGKVYKRVSGTWSVIAGNTTTNSHGNGLAVWKNYLFVFRDASIDVMKIADETWTNGWQAPTSDNLYHPALVGQDDVLYFGAANYIGSIQEVVNKTFAPGDNTTYTYNATALTLPSGYRVKCLVELGKDLLVGTWKGTQVYDVKVADIFPWDRVSSSFKIPMRLSEFGIHQMINKNNRVYIHAGIEGQWYITNGSVIEKFRKLPEYMGLGEGNYIDSYPGAICEHKGRIFFGIARGTGSASIDGFGVWSFDENGVMTFENQISTDATTGANVIAIGALLSIGTGAYLVSWRDNSAYGVDIPSANAYTGNKAYIKTDLRKVGGKRRAKKFTECEVNLAKPLASGEGIRVQYRTNLSASFTDIGTVTQASDGSVQSFIFNVPGEGVEYIQLNIGFGGTTSPRLIDVRLR